MTFEFVQNSRGEFYVLKFLEKQPSDVGDFLFRKLEIIQEYGYTKAMKSGNLKKVQQRLYEIKIPYKGNTYRIFCTSGKNKTWWLLHGIMKKSRNLSDKDIKTALSRTSLIPKY